MNHPGWLLVAIGVGTALIGMLWLVASQLPWFGKLPGDLVFEGKHTRVYFPFVTCLIISGLLTIVMWIVGRWR